MELGFGTLPERVAAGSPGTSTVTLTDDDARGVTVSETELTIAEGESGSYTVVLGSEPTEAVTVLLGVPPEAALTVAPSGLQLVFTPQNWSLPQGVTVTAASDADAVAPPAVTLTHTVAGGDYAAEAASPVTVRVTERTVPVLTLGPSTAEVSESAGTQVLVVSQSVASSETVTVDYSTSDGTAASGSDYTAASGTLTFEPGASLTQVLQVPILADALNEDDETFMVELGAAEHATVSPSSASAVTITDDDALPEVSLPSGFVFADEDDGGLDVEVSLSAASGREVRVNYATADSNTSSYRATAGEDYVAVGGTLTFAAGERAKAFRVSITDDTVDEELFEEFDLRLSDPLNAALGRSTQQSRIYDNDEKPVVSLSPAPSTSVDEGGGVTFTMGLSSVSARPVNVTYETSDGTAAAPDDYSGASGRVNVLIPAGEMSRTFLVSTTEDALDEAAETFMVRIRPNIQLDDHSTLGGADRATVTIDDNDDPPVLRVAGVEAREDAGPLVFTVTMPASGKTVTVGYAVSAGTATPGSDYTGVSSGTLTFSAGTTEQTVSVPLLDDDWHEPDETLTLRLMDPINAELGVNEATGTIREDETEPVLTLGLNPSSIDESGGISTVTAALSGKSSEAVVVLVTAAPDSPAVASDIVQSGTELTIAAGSTASTGTVTLRAEDNDVDSPDKTVTVGGSVTGGNGVVSAPPSRELTIRDDEALTVGVTGPSTVVEGDAATFPVTVTGGTSTAPVVITCRVAGTATLGDDYAPPAGMLRLAAGVDSGEITIQTLDEMVLDRGETLEVILTGASTSTGALSVSPSSAATMIVDPGAVSVSVTAGSAVTEGSAASFQVQLSGAVGSAVVVGWSTSDGTATAGADYTPVSPTTLTFPAGSTASRTLSVTTLGDTLAENEESFTVTLTGSNLPDGVSVATASATGRIADDEALTVSVSGPSTVVEEGDAATFTVSVAGGASTAPVAVTYTVGGTATAGTDHDAAPSGTLTLGAGDSGGAITIGTLDDMVLDRDETLSVTLTSATTSAGKVTADSSPAEATIVDAGTETVSVSAGGAVTEGSASTFTVELSGAVSSPVTVGWETSDATATAGSDYTVSSGTVTFVAGSAASQTLTVPTLGDTLAESEETFTVTLTGWTLPDGVSLGTATATGRITDDEALTVSVSGPSTVVEGDAATFTVSVAGGASTAPVAVTYTVGGTATVGSDYTAPSGPLMLGAGEASGTISIPTAADAVLDPGERVSVTLSGATTSAGKVTADATPAVTTIADEGTETVSVRSDGAVTEGSSATFTVELSGAVSSPVTVGWETSDGTATAGSDYTAVESGAVTFTADSPASQTITVETLHDMLGEGPETFAVTMTRYGSADRSVAGDPDGDGDDHRRRHVVDGRDAVAATVVGGRRGGSDGGGGDGGAERGGASGGDGGDRGGREEDGPRGRLHAGDAVRSDDCRRGRAREAALHAAADRRQRRRGLGDARGDRDDDGVRADGDGGRVERSPTTTRRRRRCRWS